MSTFAEIVVNPAVDGMYLFPLTQGSKVPLKGTNGQDDATNDPATLAAWSTRYPNANAGVHCAPSGLYVVDVDCGGEKVGDASWDALVMQHGHAETLTVRTPSGGLHFYYRMPPGDVLTNTAGKLGRHIDTRGNGYVVAPGSIVGGVCYEVVSDVPIVDLPEWIADAVRKPTRVEGARPALAYELADPTEVEQRAVLLSEELASAPEGEGNQTAARIAFMVGGYVGAGQLSAHVAQAILEGALAGWSFRDRASERAMYATIERQIAEGAKSPRPWTAASFPEPALSFAEPTPPPVEDEARAEVESADSESLTDPKPRPAPTDWSTDAGQARWIVGESDDLMHVKGVGWLKWDGARWAPISDEQVGKAVVAFYKREFGKAMRKWQADPENDKARTMAGFLAKQQQTSKVKAIIASLKWVTSLDGAEPAQRLDAHPDLLNTPDGVLNLRTLEVHPHDKRLLLTKITAGSYRPGEHPDWQAALTALPIESRTWLQARMGAAITGRQLADDAVFLHGGGSNGKSLFCNDGIVRALGDYALLMSSDVIASRKADATAATPDKADLRGARFVLIEELPEEFALSTKAVKELAGTGLIRARMLYQNAVTFEASHSLFINTNHLPNVTDTDWGTWRRLTLVPFPITFVARPTRDTERKGDRNLVQRVRSNESGQWDAIVTWLAQGAAAVLADDAPLVIGKRPDDDGRAEPVRDATREWRKASDRIMAYADECLIIDPASAIAKNDLVWHFNRWLADQGGSKWSIRLILDRMKGHPSLPDVEERMQQTSDVLTRPIPPEKLGDTLPTLPARTRVITGIRFATIECTCSNRAHGVHAPGCYTEAA